jgi:multimeric flavodoxin WrbA
MGRILVLYHSHEHDNTELMAKAVAEGAREAGADVTLVNTNTARLDPSE